MGRIKAIIAVIAAIAAVYFVVINRYGAWRDAQPVNIIATHYGRHLIVSNFPYTDKGKIRWWLNNKEILKKEYDFPYIYPNGYYAATIWNFGEGYKKHPGTDQGSDLACFKDMSTDSNCIEKDSIMSISHLKSGSTLFNIKNGLEYLQHAKNGKIKPMKRNY